MAMDNLKLSDNFLVTGIWLGKNSLDISQVQTSKVRSKLQKPLVSRDILHIRDFKQLNKQLKSPFEIYATKMERTLYFA